MKVIATTERFLLSNGGLEIRFTNKVTGAQETRRYKTQAAGKAAETRFHNRMKRTYDHLLDQPQQNSLRHAAARTLANDIDRLAYLIDPYEYWDVVGSRTEADIQTHVDTIAADLLAGNTEPYVTWLQDQIANQSNSKSDRARACDRLARLLTWIEKEENK